MMAIRLERSGELKPNRGILGDPEEPRKDKFIELGLLLGLCLSLMVVAAEFLYARPDIAAWPTLSHSIKSFLAAVL